MPPGLHYLVVACDDIASRVGGALDFTLEVLAADGTALAVYTTLRGTLAEVIRDGILGQVLVSNVHLGDGRVEIPATDLRLDLPLQLDLIASGDTPAPHNLPT